MFHWRATAGRGARGSQRAPAALSRARPAEEAAPAPLYQTQTALAALPADRWQTIARREHEGTVLRKQGAQFYAEAKVRAGFTLLRGVPVLPSGPSPGARVALPRCGVMAHGDDPDFALPSQADLTK